MLMDELEDVIARVHFVDFDDLRGGKLRNNRLTFIRSRVLYNLRYSPGVYGLRVRMKHREINTLFGATGVGYKIRKPDKPFRLTREYLDERIKLVHDGVGLCGLCDDDKWRVIVSLCDDPMRYGVPVSPPVKVIAHIFGCAESTIYAGVARHRRV